MGAVPIARSTLRTRTPTLLHGDVWACSRGLLQCAHAQDSSAIASRDSRGAPRRPRAHGTLAQSVNRGGDVVCKARPFAKHTSRRHPPLHRSEQHAHASERAAHHGPRGPGPRCRRRAPRRLSAWLEQRGAPPGTCARLTRTFVQTKPWKPPAAVTFGRVERFAGPLFRGRP